MVIEEEEAERRDRVTETEAGGTRLADERRDHKPKECR